jgi:hypothetical protein
MIATGSRWSLTYDTPGASNESWGDFNQRNAAVSRTHRLESGELDSISCHKLFVAQGIMADPLTLPPPIVIEKLLAAIQLWEGLQM